MLLRRAHEVPPRGAEPREFLPCSGVRGPGPAAPPCHSPEAVPVVQLALRQVPLHQVHVLPAGCAHAAGRPVGALLRQVA